MASVEELFDTGTGDSVSDREGAAANRIFKVVVDAPAAGRREDPADFVLRDPSLAGRDAVPLGSLHPSGSAKDRAGLHAYRYTVEEHLTYLTYRVRVDYTAPLVFEFEPRVPWTMNYSSGFGTKRATSITVTHDPLTGALLDTPTVVDIGPHVYKKDEDGLFHTSTSTVNQKWRREPAPGGGFKRSIKGADVSFPVGSMTVSRTLRLYPPAIHSYVLALRNRVNNDTFLTRPPGTLKFVGPNVSSRIGLVPGMTTEGVLWDIDLVFEDNDEGWLLFIQDIWNEPETGESVSYLDEANTIQFSEYTYYNDYSYEAMLAVLNGYA